MKAYSIGTRLPAAVRRLHLNEFRFQHHEDVKKCLLSAILSLPDCTNYPSGDFAPLIVSIAEFTGVSPVNVVLAAGSDEVLRAVVDTCGLRQQSKVLMVTPGYSHFLHYAQLRGLAIETYDAVDGLQPVGKFLHILAQPCLVYLGNPNNPIGGLCDQQQVKVLATTYPTCTFIVDEAYIEFSGLEHSAVHTSLSCPNVLVTRTFSKAFGLAGMRVGYGIGHSSLLDQISIALSPKAVSPYEVRVATSVLTQASYYLERAQLTRQEIQRVVKLLAEDGWQCQDGEGNFFCVYIGAKVSEAVAFLLKQGVSVRNRDDQLKGCIRITGGTREDMDAVSECLSHFRQAHPVNVYVDGIFDLFHFGHIQFLKQAKALGGATARLLVGVISDEDAAWKRCPVLTYAHRVAMLQHCTIVDEVVQSVPLVITSNFLTQHSINLVVHGDDSQQPEFFAVPLQMGIMHYVPYTTTISTSDILQRITYGDF